MVLYCFHGAARRPGKFCAFLLPSGIVFLHFKSDLDLQNDTFPFKKRYIPPKISACGGPIVPKTPFKNTPPLKRFLPFLRGGGILKRGGILKWNIPDVSSRSKYFFSTPG